MALENPRHARDPIKVVFISLSGLGVSLCIMAILSAFTGLLVGACAGILVCILAVFIETALPRGFVIHALYRMGLLKLPGLPSGTIKAFRE